MIDAVVGAVIMLIATTSLLSAVEVIEKAFADAGRQPLSPQENQLMNRVKIIEIEDGKKELKPLFKDPDELTQFWQNSVKTLPREVFSRRSE